MIKIVKKQALKSLKHCGLFSLVKNSKWRRQRLLILAYHGISLEDEHQYDPELFMHPDYFRSRLQLLKKHGCAVLPLGEAVRRLYVDDLPQNCVAITFDDGFYDFYKCAYPVIDEFKFPVTLYLTTYHVYHNRPVFNVICPYILWKGQQMTLDLKKVTGQEGRVDLSTSGARLDVVTKIAHFVEQNKLSSEEKDGIAANLAKQLKIDYDALLAKRIMNLLTPQEVQQLASKGVDIQLHTHRHRTPLDHGLFRREVEDNWNSIRSMTGLSALHFCYPSGEYDLGFLPWLEEMGIASATTCDPGLASTSDHHLLLPRFIDTSLQSPIEFEAWLSGITAFLPSRYKNNN